jgi:hypothetical protein
MTRPLTAFAVAIALGTAASAAQAQTSVTLYNDGRVLVRRTLPFQLPKGASEQRAMLGPLEPSSIFALDPDVTLLGARYDAGIDEGSILRRAVGRRVTFYNPLTPRDTIVATVLGADPERFRLADGSVVFGRPGQLRLPEELAPADAALSLTVRSGAARRGLGIGYFTGGASWNASYQVVLAGNEARVTGTAVLPSESFRADSAEVQLLAGEVGRANPPAPPRPMMMGKVAASRADGFNSEVASEQKVGEFHLYSLPGRVSLLPGVTTSVALFEPQRVPYERSYEVHGELPFWGFFPPHNDEQPVPVEVSYTLKRMRKTDFGDRPLPQGAARIFAPDSGGRVQLVGEAAVRHTAAGQDLRLSAGEAFDLTAHRIQTAYTSRRDSSKAGWRTIVTADYAVTVANATDSAATVDVLEERAGEWSVLQSSVPAEKLSATRTRFRVRVPARGEARLMYRVRVVW